MSYGECFLKQGFYTIFDLEIVKVSFRTHALGIKGPHEGPRIVIKLNLLTIEIVCTFTIWYSSLLSHMIASALSTSRPHHAQWVTEIVLGVACTYSLLTRKKITIMAF